MKILGLIPARGGSKGVPKKNIRHLAGKPLIAYTIEAAKQAGVFESILVSTDDSDIANIALEYGAEVPFLRPKEIATDSTPMLEVVKHVVTYYEENGLIFDAVCILQPTSPFRTASFITNAIAIFTSGGHDSLISVQEVPTKYNPHWTFIERNTGQIGLFTKESQPIARRQDLPKAYVREGSIYIFKIQTLKSFGNIYGEKIGYHLVEEGSVNIDTMADFEKAEKIASTFFS